MDLNSATGSLLGAVLVFVMFCTKEEGYSLETSTDNKCLLLTVWSRDPQPGRTDTSQYRTLLTVGDVNHTLGTDHCMLAFCRHRW